LNALLKVLDNRKIRSLAEIKNFLENEKNLKLSKELDTASNKYNSNSSTLRPPTPPPINKHSSPVALSLGGTSINSNVYNMATMGLMQQPTSINNHHQIYHGYNNNDEGRSEYNSM